MKNLNILEELRSKKEIVNYFKALGKNITEEEIPALKKDYKQEENSNTLTIQQLDNVAGGWGIYTNVKNYILRDKNATGLIFKRGLFERDFHAKTKGYYNNKGEVVVYDEILGALGIGRVVKMDEQNPEMQQKFCDCISSTRACSHK